MVADYMKKQPRISKIAASFKIKETSEPETPKLPDNNIRKTATRRDAMAPQDVTNLSRTLSTISSASTITSRVTDVNIEQILNTKFISNNNTDIDFFTNGRNNYVNDDTDNSNYDNPGKIVNYKNFIPASLNYDDDIPDYIEEDVDSSGKNSLTSRQSKQNMSAEASTSSDSRNSILSRQNSNLSSRHQFPSNRRW